MRWRYVDRVGVELEGGWNERPDHLQHDGSVDVNADHVGEVVSPPLRPRQIAGWIRRHYPDEVNGTCGLHVHVSVKNHALYARLMEPAFYEFFLERTRAWAAARQIRGSSPFWGRLHGDNSYCAARFRPDEQVWWTHKANGRYTHLNYAFRLHGTVECRLLPMFKSVEVAVSGVDMVVETFEAYLASVAGIREAPIRTRVDSVGAMRIELQDVADVGSLEWIYHGEVHLPARAA